MTTDGKPLFDSGADYDPLADLDADHLDQHLVDAPAPTPPSDGIEITIRNLATGDVQTRVIWDDYILICAGDRYLAGQTTYANGTHILTVKVNGSPDRPLPADGE